MEIIIIFLESLDPLDKGNGLKIENIPLSILNLTVKMIPLSEYL